ncbi:uncharacterized protein LOC103957779 isoform X1 [Pyrus x bretschneideri]|uniref:uncharacterized protein LOC103957779 isoform X1 n=1 Tax=Pyrus x bretschneideri TaxID=225117 RepID=UPI00202EFF26|nr:uncharacterized protein LOC103957779 isoform X1 [Pyrus x bretschneideri]
MEDNQFRFSGEAPNYVMSRAKKKIVSTTMIKNCTLMGTTKMYILKLEDDSTREACDKWHSDVGPRIHIILEKNKAESSKCIAHYAGEKMFQVEHMSGVQFVVDLAKHTCTCRRWNLTGIPCGHAIASICRRNEDPVTYIHSCYKKASWKWAYGPFIRPMAMKSYGHAPTYLLFCLLFIISNRVGRRK